MKLKKVSFAAVLVLTTSVMFGSNCFAINLTKKKAEQETENVSSVHTLAELEDGIYLADFSSNSSMFHVNETLDGKGTLTVKDHAGVIHVSLQSKKIVKLYLGKAEDAKAAEEGDELLLLPTEDEVTYSDGMTEIVYGFDIPIPELEEDFDCALIGEKGIWYDHIVSASNPMPLES